MSCKRVLISTCSKQRIYALPRNGCAHAVQRGVIGKVLVDAEIKVEGTRLEHYAEPTQRFAGSASDVVAEDSDRAVARIIEVTDQRKQCRLAGPVETKKHREGAGRNGKGNVDKRLFCTVGMADRVHLESRGSIRRPACMNMLHPARSSLFVRRAGMPERWT